MNEINEVFEDVIGQEAVKTTLSLFLDGFAATGRIPNLMLTTQRGGGKTYLARKFRSAMVRPDGTTPPILEVNAESIKGAVSFFEQVFPVWDSNDAVLFIDEAQNLPKDLQQIFLTALNIEKNPVRTVTVDGDEYTFDFRRIHLILATTDQQKLATPLRDRLRNISLSDYTPDELYEVFEQNLEYEISVDPAARETIKSYFRGNPRDAVVKADELLLYCRACHLKSINTEQWLTFCRTMGICPYGLNNAELQIVKLLGERGTSTLGTLAAATGFERSAIQKDYESVLIRKGLLELDGKRVLTNKGKALYNEVK